MNQNGGIHKGGFAVLCHRNGGSESPGILTYDSSKVLEVRRQLKEQGYGILCDHSNVFRDEDDRTVVTFSPYHDISSDVAGEIFLPGYDVEISNLSIYGLLIVK